jgi:hypothetical protein
MKTYKLKTHKATAKRVHVTGSGKYMHLPFSSVPRDTGAPAIA